MNDKVVSLYGPAKISPAGEEALKEHEWIEASLALIDDLREAVSSGRIKAFAAVGVDTQHRAGEWRSRNDCISELELLGAVQLLANNIPVNRQPI